MSVWCEGNTIDTILADLQMSRSDGDEQDVSTAFIQNNIARKKARKMIEEVVEKHYRKRKA